MVQDVVELVPFPLLAGRQPGSAQFPLAVGGIMSPGRGGCAFSFHARFLGRAREVSARPQRPRRLGPSPQVPDVSDRAGRDAVTARQSVGHGASFAFALFARQKDGDRLLCCQDAHCARRRRGPRWLAVRQAHSGVRRARGTGLFLVLTARACPLTRARAHDRACSLGVFEQREQRHALGVGVRSQVLDRAGCFDNMLTLARAWCHVERGAAWCLMVEAPWMIYGTKKGST